MTKGFLFGMALSGFTVGTLTGLSRNPVAEAVIPALFGLLAGTGGVLAVLTERTRARLADLGWTLTCFMLPLLFGVVLGMFNRLGVDGCVGFFGHAVCARDPLKTFTSLRDAPIELEILAHLEVLGATPEQRRRLTRSMLTATLDRDALVRTASDLQAACSQAADLVQSIDPRELNRMLPPQRASMVRLIAAARECAAVVPNSTAPLPELAQQLWQTATHLDPFELREDISEKAIKEVVDAVVPVRLAIAKAMEATNSLPAAVATTLRNTVQANRQAWLEDFLPSPAVAIAGSIEHR